MSTIFLFLSFHLVLSVRRSSMIRALPAFGSLHIRARILRPPFFRFSFRLTAADVAKSEYRALFGLEAERPDSVASIRTIKPKKSLKSLKSVPSFASIASVIPTYDHVPPLPLDDFIPPSASILPLLERLFDDLRFISRALPATYTEADFDALKELLADVVGMGNMLITLARDPVEAVAESLREAQSSIGRVSDRSAVCQGRRGDHRRRCT